MSLLNNAVDSIILGVEDFRSEDDRRLLSAVRNFYAGVMLLFKHKLALLSPPGSDEILLKPRFEPVIGDEGSLSWMGKGQTIGFDQIRNRFKSLEIEVDWGRVKAIQSYRNNIEHYYESRKPEAVRTLIADCFFVVSRFVCTELDEEPETLFGDTTWAYLVGLNEAYEMEQAECEASIEKVDWCSEILHEAVKMMRCNNCGSGLIKILDDEDSSLHHAMRCSVCDAEWGMEDATVRALAQWERRGQGRRAPWEPSSIAIANCPECGNNAYVVAEQKCLVCEEEGPYECALCCNLIPPEELEWGEEYCTWCRNVALGDD